MKDEEYQFRGKCIGNGEWVFGFYYKTLGKHIILGDKDPYSSGQREFEVIPETVGIYSGFLDNNNRKIFQGDIIVKIGGNDEKSEIRRVYTFEVINKNGCIKSLTADSYDLRRDGYPLFQEYESICELKREHPEIVLFLEVIDNVHDNPDLRIYKKSP